ncbi:MAG: histidine kinase [Crocinitomicaceae bacterium]|nr:histidine kinase [Crocinitomicaceae bacterium]
MLRVLSFLFVCCFSFVSFSQKYAFVTYSTEDGLPQSQVTSITQDAQGYLWVGTLGGLAKFDGTKFTSFSSNQGLLNNRITSLSFFDNKLWVGHDGGISTISNNDVRQIGFRGNGNDKSRSVSEIIKFNNRVYVCSNGGGLFKVYKNELKKVKLGDVLYEKIRAAHVHGGKLFLATKGGVLVTEDGVNFERLTQFDLDLSFSGVDCNEDFVVFSTYSSGVFVQDLQSGKVKKYASEELRHNVYGCYIDESGRIWLNTLGGVVNINLDGSISFLDDTNGLPVNMITCFFNDSEGNIWIGSAGKGFFRIPSSDFKYYDKTTGMPTDLFLTGFQNENGDYYFGTYDKGVTKKSADGVLSELNIEESTIWSSVHDVNGKDFFGTSSSLVEVNNDGSIRTYQFEDNPNIPGTKITSFFKDEKGGMYIGGNAGVSYYFNGQFKRLGKKKDIDIGTVYDIEFKGEKLYCSTNLGIQVYENGTFNILEGADQVSYNIERDGQGVIWYGSEEGLYRIVNDRPERVSLLEDAGANFVAFLNYKNDQLFIGTNNGLFIVSNLNEAVPSFKRFGVKDGIIDLESNQNSGFFDDKGDFWFGTASGLVSFKLNDAIGVSADPKILLTSILLNYNDFDYSKYSADVDEFGLPLDLDLPYSKNNLIFEVNGISLVHHKGLKYQYLVEGLIESWSSLSENSTITFTSLPAGDFVLRVRAVDVDGRMSSEVVFPFVINDAYYNRWWFILFMIIGVTSIVFFIFRFRLKRLADINEKEKLEYKSRLLSLEQKSMNASMNRHFIFNSLNSIQYFINTQDKLSANKYLTNFAKLIRKNLDSATAKGNVISLEEELERLELYLSLESIRFKDRFDYRVETNGVDVESVLIPPMLMQPFIENSIIHGILPNESKKGLIVIDVRKVDGFLYISIEDNGMGIKQSMKNKSTLDGDHRSQGMEITSKRIELIHKVSNNNISLEGPEEIIGNDGSINGTYVLIKIPLSDLEI